MSSSLGCNTWSTFGGRPGCSRKGNGTWSTGEHLPYSGPNHVACPRNASPPLKGATRGEHSESTTGCSSDVACVLGGRTCWQHRRKHSQMFLTFLLGVTGDDIRSASIVFPRCSRDVFPRNIHESPLCQSSSRLAPASSISGPTPFLPQNYSRTRKFRNRQRTIQTPIVGLHHNPRTQGINHPIRTLGISILTTRNIIIKRAAQV